MSQPRARTQRAEGAWPGRRSSERVPPLGDMRWVDVADGQGASTEAQSGARDLSPEARSAIRAIRPRLPASDRRRRVRRVAVGMERPAATPPASCSAGGRGDAIGECVGDSLLATVLPYVLTVGAGMLVCGLAAVVLPDGLRASEAAAREDRLRGSLDHGPLRRPVCRLPRRDHAGRPDPPLAGARPLRHVRRMSQRRAYRRTSLLLLAQSDSGALGFRLAWKRPPVSYFAALFALALLALTCGAQQAAVRSPTAQPRDK